MKLFSVIGVGLLLLAVSSQAATVSVKVVGITDGDTVTVIDNTKKSYKVRLDQIDAPERRQAYGNRAKQHLSALVYKKTVMMDWNSKDRYGRILGTLFYQGKNINYQMVADGYAWAYTKYLRNQIYLDAQKVAKRERLGLWSDENPIPPWDWRKRK